MARNAIARNWVCQTCVGKSCRTPRACAACGKQLPAAPKIPNRSLPKGQHRQKRK